MTKNEVYLLVQRIKDYMNISESSYPLDMLKICGGLNGLAVEKMEFRTSQLRGMIAVSGNPHEKSVILLNSAKTFVEQNYHCAHEFMHLFCDDRTAVLIEQSSQKIIPSQNKYVEWFANEGAAELLVPYKLFIPMFSCFYDLYMGDQVTWDKMSGGHNIKQVMSFYYKVSEMVIGYRIESLSYEIAQYRSGVAIDNIEVLSRTQQQRRSIEVPSFLNLIDTEEIKRTFTLDWDGILRA